MTFIEELQATSAVGAGRFDAAIGHYRRLLARDPNDSVSLAMIAHCYELKGDLEAAFHTAQEFLAKSPNDFEMLMLVVRYWSKRNDEEKTYHYVSRVVVNPPGQSSPPPMPRYVERIKKLFMLIPPVRRLVLTARSSLAKSTARNQEDYEWAVQFKRSYDARHGIKDEPRVH